MFDILFVHREKGKIVAQHLVRGPFVHIVVKDEQLTVYRSLVHGNEVGEVLAILVVRLSGIDWQTPQGDFYNTWSMWSEAAGRPKPKKTKRRTILVEEEHDSTEVIPDQGNGGDDSKDRPPDI